MATLADLLIEVGLDVKEIAKSSSEVEGKLKKTWSSVTKAAALGGAAIGGALLMGIDQGLDAEVATDKLAAQLGAEGKEAQDLGKYAGDLYAKGFGGSMDEVSAAVGGVISSFGNLDKDGGVEAVTGKVLNLAKAFEVDVDRAAQVASQAVTSGLAKDATQALDLLTYSMQNVPAAVREDLLDAVDEYGPFLSSIGVTGEQAFGLLTKSAEKGMYGIDKTGDALKEFTIRATDMSSASKAGYDILGMSQKDMSAALLKGGKTGEKAFNQIIDGLIKIKDPVKQSQAALALFGTPLEDLGVTEIPKFLKGLGSAEQGMDDAAGAADRMGKTLNDNAKTKLEGFKRAAQAALIEQLGKAIPYIEKTFGWLQKNSDWVQPLAIGLGILAAAIGVVVAVQWAWNAALALSPVTWIIIGIVALIAVIVLVATKTKFFQTVWGAVWGFLKGVGSWFAGPFANFFISAWQHIWGVLKAIGAWFAGPFAGFFVSLWNRIVSVFRWGVNMVKAYINTWRIMFGLVKSWAGSAINYVVSNFNRLVSFFSSIRNRVRSVLSGFWDGLRSGFRVAINYVIGKWNSLHFTIPSFSILGKSFGGGTVGVPGIPYMADGAFVTGPTLAMVGEGSEPEVVAPLSKVPQLAGRDDRPIVLQVVPGGEVEFRRWVQKSIRVKGPLGA